MKNIVFAAVIVCILALAAATGHASDYKGEDRGSVFQVLGDLITGNYKVDGKPIKEKGWFQLSADQTKKMKLSEREDATDATKPEAKP